MVRLRKDAGVSPSLIMRNEAGSRSGEGAACTYKVRELGGDSSGPYRRDDLRRRSGNLVFLERARKQALLIALAGTLCAQSSQQGGRPGWPCVPGRPIDPSYLEISESTGGQLFLFQKGEVHHAALVMSANSTHPSTVLRAVGHLSGSREFEFPVDSSMDSVLVLASMQCRHAIAVMRPNGAEMTASNSAENVELQGGRLLRVEAPEPGRWKVRLTGTGLYVLSVLAKTPITFGNVRFLEIGGDSSDPEYSVRLTHPRLAFRQWVEANLGGEVSTVRFQLTDAAGNQVRSVETPEQSEDGAYRAGLTPQAARFRVIVTALDPAGWPVQRTHPVLFHAEEGK